jgi:hypothetical protein
VQVLNARFTRITFGGRIVLVGALLNFAGIPLENHTLSLNFRLRFACRRLNAESNILRFSAKSVHVAIFGRLRAFLAPRSVAA